MSGFCFVSIRLNTNILADHNFQASFKNLYLDIHKLLLSGPNLQRK